LALGPRVLIKQKNF